MQLLDKIHTVFTAALSSYRPFCLLSTDIPPPGSEFLQSIVAGSVTHEHPLLLLRNSACPNKLCRLNIYRDRSRQELPPSPPPLLTCPPPPSANFHGEFKRNFTCFSKVLTPRASFEYPSISSLVALFQYGHSGDAWVSRMVAGSGSSWRTVLVGWSTTPIESLAARISHGGLAPYYVAP